MGMYQRNPSVCASRRKWCGTDSYSGSACCAATAVPEVLAIVPTLPSAAAFFPWKDCRRARGGVLLVPSLLFLGPPAEV